MSWPIMTTLVMSEADVVAARQRARKIAELLGFDRQDQTRIATAVSEIARNAQSYGKGGRAEFLIDAETSPQMMLIRISDQGQGIKGLESILGGGYRSPTGMGLGLIGAKRLMDHFRIETGPGHGTMVELGHKLPRRAPLIARPQLAQLVDELGRHHSNDPISALSEQNRELLQSLNELRERQDEAARLNKELEDTNRGVVALYAELDEKAEQLRQASELKSRFLSNMSHEFRTPLNSILALARLLLDRVDGDLTLEQERQVGYMKRSAESLLDLVNDLLDIAKVEAGKVDVKPTEFTVNELFGALRGTLKPLQTNPDVDLVFDDASDVPPLFADEGKVAQILRNFISNALKFTEAGEVRVKARHIGPADKIEISVRDTGIGIAAEDQNRIFEEFMQVESRHQRAVKGTGLGLPLSRKLAELMGGNVRLESESGRGAEFTLVLPFTSRDLADPMRELPGGRKRILIVDDDEAFRYMIRHVIDKTRFDVIEAGDGEQGIETARQEHPDLIVLDLQMPKRDGFAALQDLRVDPETRLIPVVISTSLAIDDELRSRLPGAASFLPKKDLSQASVSLILQGALQTFVAKP